VGDVVSYMIYLILDICPDYIPLSIATCTNDKDIPDYMEKQLTSLKGKEKKHNNLPLMMMTVMMRNPIKREQGMIYPLWVMMMMVIRRRRRRRRRMISPL
jgi:hypothetical protein